MENKKIKGIAAGALVITALGNAGTANANELFSLNDLGNGSTLRAELMSLNALSFMSNASSNMNIEATCGEKSKEAKCGEKGKEAKCGEKGKEGKCGEKAKKGSTKGTKTTKGKEAKCGEKGKEGKCGEKGKEAKCGEKGKEGKCGEKPKAN
ncbi:MAG TPA: hypothetical protein VD905_22010 [Flavobacteriales bacterium]|nr:hypothetical protein [Flavobacteriales bacterium]